MRTRTTKPRKVNVVTLGCAKNIYDSEVLMGQLRANEFEVEHELPVPPVPHRERVRREPCNVKVRCIAPGFDGLELEGPLPA